jgi:hypothetical protein
MKVDRAICREGLALLIGCVILYLAFPTLLPMLGFTSFQITSSTVGQFCGAETALFRVLRKLMFFGGLLGILVALAAIVRAVVNRLLPESRDEQLSS